MTVEKTPPTAVSSDTEIDSLAHEAVALAAQLLRQAAKQQSRSEKAQSAKFAGMMEDATGKTFTMAMSDQAFRSHDPGRVADQIKHLIDGYGIPAYFTAWERLALRLGTTVAQIMPSVVVPLIVAKLRTETQNVILPSEEKEFKEYLQTRRAGSTRLNINQLGEAILGEEEAGRRLDAYLKLLARPDIEYISVKISSIFSQINLLAFDHTVEEIKTRLRQLYRAAMAHAYVSPNGREGEKFVNLDMEEYRDLRLTVAAFKEVLDEEEFLHHRAGIVLQAYLPDSFPYQQELTQWALARVARGGAPIKMRLVKGANLAMERVEADWHGWPQAPYTTKADVDANFKRMVTYGSTPERTHAVNLGIASHNLFDVAYGLLLRAKYGLHDTVEFEMLEGMANHQARAVQEEAEGLLLYAPIVKQEDFHSAISYLVRRLDENTAEENFLHDLFGLEVGTPEWEKQKGMFFEALQHMDTAQAGPNRTQDRRTEEIEFDPQAPFENESDTDWTLPANVAWITAVRDRWQQGEIPPIPLQIGGETIQTENWGEGTDPARPAEIAYRYSLASEAQIDRALDIAKAAQADWQTRPVTERRDLLVSCASHLARHRGELIGAMLRDGGKVVTEADVEISEAIDFANYYARNFTDLQMETKDLIFRPFGTVLITPPWNFPLAIPCGGVLAALMAGNTVILKPAPEATLIGWQLAQVLWEAGIPRDVLQFVPTTDDAVGRGLVTDPRVNAVILTGAYETGQLFLSWKPELKLLAETSGKNSLIITAMADRDQAIKDLVKSAFGHAGQKCSAASLAVLEAEVYDDPAFRRQLRDAAASLSIGPAWDFTNVMPPVIREPSPELACALTQLDPGESWLLEPQQIDGQHNWWTPGIKLGVQPGSFFHTTECFGPVLGLMRAENLIEAIEIVNSSEFGLTSGIHSLDDREIEFWKEHIEVGNAYINRSTTGAIVQRQPFGGWKKSVFGTAKAGGPNYVLSLGTWEEKDHSEPWESRLTRAKESYERAWWNEFRQLHDPTGLLGERNTFRYRPLEKMLLRVTGAIDMQAIALVKLAAETCNVRLEVSLPYPQGENAFRDLSSNGTHVVVEREDSLLKRLWHFERVRVLGPISPAFHEKANEQHVHLIDDPVVANGRIELRHYLREQAVSETIHRYGNIFPPPGAEG